MDCPPPLWLLRRQPGALKTEPAWKTWSSALCLLGSLALVACSRESQRPDAAPANSQTEARQQGLGAPKGRESSSAPRAQALEVASRAQLRALSYRRREDELVLLEKTHPERPEFPLALGKLKLDQGQLETAATCLLRSRALAQKRGDFELEREAEQGLREWALRTSEGSQARAYLREPLSLREKLRLWQLSLAEGSLSAQELARFPLSTRELGRLDAAELRALEQLYFGLWSEAGKKGDRRARLKLALAMLEQTALGEKTPTVFLETLEQEGRSASLEASFLDYFRRLGEAARPRQLEQSWQALEAAWKQKFHPGERALYLGNALYFARVDDVRAADLLLAAAKLRPKDAAEAQLKSARALLRAGEHRRAQQLLSALGRGRGKSAESARLLSLRALFFSQGPQKSLPRLAAQQRAGSSSELTRYYLAALLSTGQAAKAERLLSSLLGSERQEREQLRLKQLLGYARELQHRDAEALEVYQQVWQASPLSLPALFARARAEKLAPQQALRLPPAESAPAALPPELPALSYALLKAGLDEAAERSLLAAESKSLPTGSNLCEVYAQLDVATRRYQVAQSLAQVKELGRGATADNLWQWNCLYPRPYLEMVQTVSHKEPGRMALLYGIMRQESAFRPEVSSPAQAVGLLQMIPTTMMKVLAEAQSAPEDWERELLELQPSSSLPDLGAASTERLREPRLSISLGARYLERLKQDLGAHPVLVAAAYNSGPEAVFSWLQGASLLPADLFAFVIPFDETRTYVERVLSGAARYHYLLTGTDGGFPIELELPAGLVKPANCY